MRGSAWKDTAWKAQPALGQSGAADLEVLMTAKSIPVNRPSLGKGYVGEKWEPVYESGSRALLRGHDG